MYFIIKDNKNTRWAYGDVNGKNPSLPEIIEYLKTSLHPEIFTIVFFNENKILGERSILEYTKIEEVR